MALLDELNPYSRRFAERLLAAHPEWEGRLTLTPWPNAEPGSFVVAVPSPADPERELWVSTDGGEVTVGFGREWHAHYGERTGDDEADSFAQALDDVEGILTERLVLATGFRGGEPIVAALIPAGHPPAFGGVEAPGLERVEIASWLGTHDGSAPA
jgi:hypothetical protein